MPLRKSIPGIAPTLCFLEVDVQVSGDAFGCREASLLCLFAHE